uniref:Uncharacterized protein n=1 Tax=Theileria parva TaxID=5875 RepID=Q4N2Q0_THEPA|eukprot:XP_763931.1 hypothetical protein [Theileria parva strain Muguga]
MPCKKCESKLSKLATPDVKRDDWKPKGTNVKYVKCFCI